MSNPLRDLLREVAQKPMLSADEERELARRSKAGDEAALHRLAESHLRLVVSLARLYRGSGLPISDLIQEGTLGLLHAIRKFNPDQREARLATYASWWVRAAMQEHVLRSWSVVKIGTTTAQKSLALAIRKRLREGAGHLGEDIAAKLAAGFNATASEVRLLARRIAHGDRSMQEGDAGELLDSLATPEPDPEAILVERSFAKRRRELIEQALARLSPREALIIARRHFDEKVPSLETLAREMNLSKERVRQLEKAALAKLRDLLAPALREAEGLA